MPEELMNEFEEELLDEKERTYEEFQEMLQVGCKNESDKVDSYNKGIEKALELFRSYREKAKRMRRQDKSPKKGSRRKKQKLHRCNGEERDASLYS